MIWLIFAALLALSFIFVVAPLLRDPGPPADEAIATAREQMRQLEDDLAADRISAPVAEQTRRALEQRVLDNLNADKQNGVSAPFMRMVRLIVPLALALGGVGLYVTIGTPDFDKKALYQRAAPPISEERQAAEQLVAGVQAKIASGAETPTSIYVFLARALMSLERYDEALDAYRTASERPDVTSEWRDEFERAKAYVASNSARLPTPSAQAMQDADSLTPEQREQMIAGMVSGLALRLEDNPDDLEGWTRLIRARVVLGQVAQARLDLGTARTEFQDDDIGRDVLSALADELALNTAE